MENLKVKKIYNLPNALGTYKCLHQVSKAFGILCKHFETFSSCVRNTFTLPKLITRRYKKAIKYVFVSVHCQCVYKVQYLLT